jgi:hypothetical protein
MKKIGMAVFYLWMGLALLGEFPTVRWILLVLGVAAAFCGDRYIAIGIAALVVAALIAKYNPPRFS